MSLRQIPLVDYLVLDEVDHLVANCCVDCGADYFDRRNACARCGGRSFSNRELGTTGVIESFTIVHRAATGVPAPFASAVVRLHTGGVVKANVLTSGPPTPENVRVGMWVELATFEVARNEDTRVLGFGFRAEMDEIKP